MEPLIAWSSSAPTLLAILALLLLACAAGAVGSLLGLGGGTFLVPGLVLLFGFDFHIAVAASLVSIVANSLGASARSVEEGMTDLRVGMFLETATAVGGLAGAALAVTVLASRPDVLTLAFIPAVLAASVVMFRTRAKDSDPTVVPDRVATRLRLGGTYYDEHLQRTVTYPVHRTGAGLALSGLAGFSSGLLGIGGGVFKVPAMNAVMNVPIRVAGSTSMFMIGLTATAGGLVYLLVGDVILPLAGTVVLGVLVGSYLGGRIQTSTPAPRLKAVFAAVLVIAALLMALRVFGVVG
ncbi:MAG: sulfite exporter TauE/SafE family protein [Thermoplasmata archaeon]|nr:sulfite exporter TauE/SafE family protein [Thermoplasmata archaeon]